MSAPDVGILLARALERAADAAGVALTVAAGDWTRWASATFTGARHELLLLVADTPAARAWLADLPEAELAVRGQLVADLRIARRACAAAGLAIIIEALTVEER